MSETSSSSRTWTGILGITLILIGTWEAPQWLKVAGGAVLVFASLAAYAIDAWQDVRGGK